MICGSIFLLAFVIVKLLHLWRRVTISVLRPAITISILAVSGWIISCLFSLVILRDYQNKVALLDQCWFWTAVLSCCPFISVLGAKRPTSRVWTWFIIIPLVAVLGWPAVTALAQLPEIIVLEVQLPVFVGFVLVLVMGVGNYLGTRFGISALLCGIAVLLLLWPLSNLFKGDLESANRWRAVAGLIVGTGILLGFRQARRPILVESDFDRLWFDFSDIFGIVWSMRIQERINHSADQENWSVRLGPEGFRWNDTTTAAEKTHSVERLEHTLRWLLRRFVEPEWIDQRLKISSNSSGEES